MNQKFDDIIDSIREKDPRYRFDAYVFTMEALAFTQKKFKRRKHVTGEELLEGIRELLVKNFGPMSMSVLDHWGIKTTEDFGNIVFNLVGNKVLSKTEEDTIERFKDAYDLKEVLDVGYRRQLKKRIKRMRSF